MIKTLNNYEHMVLTEWAYWVRSELYIAGVSQGPLAIKRWSPNPLSDDLMLAVDRAIAGLPRREKSVIKAWYLGRVQDDEKSLDIALDEFSNAYRRLPVGLRPDFDFLESRAQLFYRNEQ